MRLVTVALVLGVAAAFDLASYKFDDAEEAMIKNMSARVEEYMREWDLLDHYDPNYVPPQLTAEQQDMIRNLTARTQEQMVFPGQTWERVRPEQAGMDAAKVNAAVHYGRGGLLLESYCVSIHRNGRLVADGYWQGATYTSTQIIWSVAKAFVATLIGIAEHRGIVRTESPARTWIPQWGANHPSAAVTIDQILRHNSGRYYDAITDFVLPQFVDDQTVMAIGLRQQHAPGSRDQYNQLAMQLLERVLTQANSEPVQTTTTREIYRILRFESNSFWQMNSFFIGRPQRSPLIYGGMTTSCADLGRFGHLWLNRGNWAGSTVFSSAFFDKAMDQPQTPYGRARKYGNWADRGDNRRSNGLGNQVVAFNPVNGLVMTRIGVPTSTSVAFSYNTFMDMVNDAVTDFSAEEKALAATQWMIG